MTIQELPIDKNYTSYNIEVEDSCHTFVANSIVVHNIKEAMVMN